MYGSLCIDGLLTESSEVRTTNALSQGAAVVAGKCLNE